MKIIEGTNGKYAVTKNGKILSLKTMRYMKTRVNRNGYEEVQLYVNGKCRVMSVHRIVAKAWIDNPEGKPCVNHIDENKLNNSSDNLEWVTHGENVNRGTWNIRGKERKKWLKRKMFLDASLDTNPNKKILQKTTSGITVGKWSSISAVYRAIGKTMDGNLSKALKNRRVFYGYKWEYIA